MGRGCRVPILFCPGGQGKHVPCAPFADRTAPIPLGIPRLRSAFAPICGPNCPHTPGYTPTSVRFCAHLRTELPPYPWVYPDFGPLLRPWCAALAASRPYLRQPAQQLGSQVRHFHPGKDQETIEDGKLLSALWVHSRDGRLVAKMSVPSRSLRGRTRVSMYPEAAPDLSRGREVGPAPGYLLRGLAPSAGAARGWLKLPSMIMVAPGSGSLYQGWFTVPGGCSG